LFAVNKLYQNVRFIKFGKLLMFSYPNAFSRAGIYGIFAYYKIFDQNDIFSSLARSLI
jgi:hypothetical protein